MEVKTNYIHTDRMNCTPVASPRHAAGLSFNRVGATTFAEIMTAIFERPSGL
jgi:hypothetical protein